MQPNGIYAKSKVPFNDVNSFSISTIKLHEKNESKFVAKSYIKINLK